MKNYFLVYIVELNKVLFSSSSTLHKYKFIINILATHKVIGEFC